MHIYIHTLGREDSRSHSNMTNIDDDNNNYDKDDDHHDI
jgi:hypothetical protein